MFERLRDKIAQGELAVGSKLPSARDLANQEGVSINTAQRTLAKLSAQNLIESAAGRASVVVARTSRVVPVRPIQGQQVAAVMEVAHLGDERNISVRRWGSHIASACSEFLHKHSVQLVIVPYERGTKDVVGAVRQQLDQLGEKLIGIVCFPGPAGMLQDELLKDRSVHCVHINRTARNWSHNFVSSDYIGAGRCAGWYFAQINCRHVLLLGVEIKSSMSWQEVTSGVIQSYLAGGMNPGGINIVQCNAIGGGMDEAEAHEVISEYLRRNPHPDGILAAGDYLALGAIRACREAELSIPGDVNVIGGSGDEMSKFIDPPLSVVAQPVEHIGHEAANLLIEMVQMGVDRLPGRILPTPVVLRGSTRLSEEIKSKLRPVNSEYHFSEIPA